MKNIPTGIYYMVGAILISQLLSKEEDIKKDVKRIDRSLGKVEKDVILLFDKLNIK